MGSSPARSLWVLAPLREARVRAAGYAALALLVFVVAALTIRPFKGSFDFVNSDGRWYYVYLPSLVIDGDLDFTNQVRAHWGGDAHPPLDGPPTPGHTADGRLKNKYPVGVALTLAPSFLLAHAVAVPLHAMTGAAWCFPDGYSVPYQVFNLLWILGLTAAGLALADGLATRALGVNPAVAFLAVGLYWVGSPLIHYSFREPYMAHAVGSFWVTAALALAWSQSRGVPRAGLSAGGLFLLAFCVTLAVLCRPTNAVIVLPVLVWLLASIIRAGRLPGLLARLPVALLGVTPLLAQLLVWRSLSGQWVHYSYEGEGFHWTRPVLGLTLFSSRHGLFFWSPLLLLALGGLAWHVRRARAPGLVACLAASFLLLWYCNAAWACWSFGDAFGGRAYLELGAVFVAGLAGALEAAHRARPAVRHAFAGAVLVSLAWQGGLFALYTFKLIPRDDYLF